MHPMTDGLQRALRSMRDTHEALYRHVSRAREQLKTMRMTQADRVDIALLLKLVGELADDVRKEAEQTSKTVQEIACAVYVKETLMDPDPPRSLHGELGIGTPEIKKGVNLPSKRREPERYERVMRSLGVPEDLIASGIVKVHWPGMVEHLTKLATSGLPLPDGISAADQYDVFALSPLRRRPGVSMFPGEPAPVPAHAKDMV